MAPDQRFSFPFNVSPDTLADPGPRRQLKKAAQCNSIESLEAVRQRLGGGCFYYEDVARAALVAGHFDFWREYLLACRYHCIATTASYDSWRYFLEPICILFYSDLDDVARFEAVKFVIEVFVPNLPAKDEIVTSELNTFRLPPEPETIWAQDELLTGMLALPDYRDFLYSALMPGSEPILRYLLEEVGMRCNLKHLRRVVCRFRPDLYALVLAHLSPGIPHQQQLLPDNCQYQKPSSDSDFLIQITDAAWCCHYRHSRQDVATFLQYNREFVDKLPAAVTFFQDVCDGKADLQQCHEWIRELLGNDHSSYGTDRNELEALSSASLRLSKELCEEFQISHEDDDATVRRLDLTAGPYEIVSWLESF